MGPNRYNVSIMFRWHDVKGEKPKDVSLYFVVQPVCTALYRINAKLHNPQPVAEQALLRKPIDVRVEVTILWLWSMKSVLKGLKYSLEPFCLNFWQKIPNIAQGNVEVFPQCPQMFMVFVTMYFPVYGLKLGHLKIWNSKPAVIIMSEC